LKEFIQFLSSRRRRKKYSSSELAAMESRDVTIYQH